MKQMKLPSHITQAPEILRQFMFYQKSQHWSRQQILDYQNSKLKEIVAYAGKYVPYYRKLFQDIELDTSSFRGIEDLDNIPFLDKETLRSRQEEFIADTVHDLDARVEKTSGSRGTPLRLMIDKHSRANKYAAYARAYRWAGYSPGALRFVVKGFSESKSKDWGYDVLRNMIYLNSSRMNKENCLEVAKLVSKLKPSIYEGYARSFIDLHNQIKDECKLSSPRGIFVYGETVTPGIRDHVQKVFGSHLFDFYSHAENSVMICEKPDGRRYLMEDFFYPELICAEAKPAEEGYGELVGTSFYNYAMPFIRYKTRDYVRLAPDQSKNFREVLSIEGRMDDYILMPDGRKIYFAEGALGYAEGIVAAQYIQDETDHLTVNLIVEEGFSANSYPLITQGLVKRLGPSLRFSFKIVSELERKDSGKTPFIIRKI